jgi:phosphonate transport system substrate-binding protein
VGAVIEGRAHAAWAPPIAHARAVRDGAELIAIPERRGLLAFRSALLVRTESVWVSPAGMRGVRAAWTDPSSASGYLFPRMHLEAAGVDPKRDLTEHFHGSARRACEAVLSGEADLCACFVRPDSAGDPQLALADVDRIVRGASERLRVIALTDVIPPDGIIFGPALAAADRHGVRDALLELHRTPEGRTALDLLMQAERLVPPNEHVLRLIARLRAHAPVP